MGQGRVSWIGVGVLALLLAACQGGAPPSQPPLAQPNLANADGAQKPPAYDKNGNPNYDASGTYIGGRGLGTTVDSPEDPTASMVPQVEMPDVSKMNCTGSTGANAGTLNCSN